MNSEDDGHEMILFTKGGELYKAGVSQPSYKFAGRGEFLTVNGNKRTQLGVEHNVGRGQLGVEHHADRGQLGVEHHADRGQLSVELNADRGQLGVERGGQLSVGLNADRGQLGVARDHDTDDIGLGEIYICF